MSWEIFKQNVLRVANNPQSIDDIDIVAETYANEYDAAVKRGGDTVNLVSVKTGNVEAMKQIFTAALQKGLSSNVPYDLVGEMGKGVIAYWTGATLNEFPIPVIPAIGSAQNISVTTNIVINPGTWAPVLVSPSAQFQLTPEKRAEYVKELEEESAKLVEAKLVEPPEILVAREDKVSNLVGVLLENEEYRETIPYTQPILTANTVTGPTGSAENDGLFDEEGYDTEGDEFYATLGDGNLTAADLPTFPQTLPRVIPQSEGSPSGGPYQKSTPYFPAGATVGEKALAIALTDLKDGVAEDPKGSDGGHDRIIEMQKYGAGGGTGFAWCACAVATWWIEAGVSLEGHKNKAYVPTWWDWAAETNRLLDVREGRNPNFVPKVGDAVIYGWGATDEHRGFDHIGLVAGFNEDGSIFGIDGNWSSAVAYNRTNKKAIRGFVVIG
jgi:hypothetical protein